MFHIMISAVLTTFLWTSIVLSPCYAQSGPGKLGASRYADPKGFFSLIPPEGWKATEFPQDPRGRVAFVSPQKTGELRILASAVDFGTLDQLLAFCRDMERRTGLACNIKRIDFRGRPAVERTFTVKGMRFVVIDFLVGQVNHNLQFAAPQEKFAALLPLAQKSMETYEPAAREVTAEEIKKHQIAKKLGLARLMVEQKNYDQARQYVKEGLEIDAKTPEFLKLDEELKKNLGGGPGG